MKNIINKNIFRFCRFLLRIFMPAYTVYTSSKTVSPAVYIVNHQNTKGPVVTMAWFNLPLRIWSLSVFCKQKTCFRQYYDYTFTKRFGIPKFLAAVIAFLLSFFVSGLMQGMQAIPVFRGSKAIINTFKESILALVSGQSLLISPTIDYTNESSKMGEMYKGFLDLEKYYLRQTGSHLAFVPLHINNKKQCIYVGEAVYFSTEENYKQEKEEVYNRLKKELTQMAEI